MPSVLVSEPNESRSTLQSSRPSPPDRFGTNTSVRSEAESLGPSNHQNERLSPLPKTSRPNDQQDSDDSVIESNEGQASTAGPPTRPDPGSQRFVWIHLAFNNPKWVSVCLKPSNSTKANRSQDVFSTMSKERKQTLNETLLHDTVWCKRHIRGRNTCYHACFVKPGCILIDPKLSEIRRVLSV
jgi:hypothetical protein